MPKKLIFRQWLLFIIFFAIGLWGLVRVFMEGFEFMPFLFSLLQIMASILLLKWNIFDKC
jgi:hypothetical protein